MKVINNSQLKIILLILIISILFYTVFNLDRNFKKLNELKLEAVSAENNLLKEQKIYQNKIAQNNKSLQSSSINLEDRAAQIIKKSSSFDLSLLHYNSSNNQINLNFRGDFEAIYQFLKYLETEQLGLITAQIKIEKEVLDLLFSLRIIREK